MSDICACDDNECPVKEQCYRFTCHRGDRQSYFLETPLTLKGCEYFWRITTTGALKEGGPFKRNKHKH